MNIHKKKLIEDFSNHFETNYNFPPLTSKVYSYLLMDCKREGTTFDKLMEVFQASKSSISNSLNFLTQLKYIEHFSQLNDRKRLYRASSGTILVRLEKIYEILLVEKKLASNFREYVLEEIEDVDPLSIEKSNIYLDHLDQSIEHLSKTIEKLK
ncbi:MAG TPA: hypothetical protein VL022_01580 [Moheibacter sp.]|nr:hypothetical protein [Moheibacter sp.]